MTAKRLLIRVELRQLELELNDARLRIPWGGHSPRTLTKMWKTRILSEPPTGGPVQGDPLQFTAFLKGNPSWLVE